MGLFTHQGRKQCKNGALLCKKKKKPAGPPDPVSLLTNKADFLAAAWTWSWAGPFQVRRWLPRISRPCFGCISPNPHFCGTPSPLEGLHYTSNRGLGMTFPAAVR